VIAKPLMLLCDFQDEIVDCFSSQLRADVRCFGRCLGTRFEASVFFRGMSIRPKSI
jgi:hypothetical protein